VRCRRYRVSLFTVAASAGEGRRKGCIKNFFHKTSPRDEQEEREREREREFFASLGYVNDVPEFKRPITPCSLSVLAALGVHYGGGIALQDSLEIEAHYSRNASPGVKRVQDIGNDF